MLRNALSEFYKYVADSERVRRRPGRVRLLVIKPPANNTLHGYRSIWMFADFYIHTFSNLTTSRAAMHRRRLFAAAGAGVGAFAIGGAAVHSEQEKQRAALKRPPSDVHDRPIELLSLSDEAMSGQRRLLWLHLEA